MRRVEFVVAGSPNDLFFSQIAASKTSILGSAWTRWQPSYKCIFGGEIDWPAVERWMPLLADVDVEFLSRQRFAADGYFAQSERRFNTGIGGVDAFVFLDADTFMLGSIEDALDDVSNNATIAGVQAHYGFPTNNGPARLDNWKKLARDLLGTSMTFDRAYSLVPADDPPETRVAPFYINAGVVFVSPMILGLFYRTYCKFRARAQSYLASPYFAGQVSIALATAYLDIDPISLPMRYNFPNDPVADARYPDDLADVRIMHFLRMNDFDRTRIFARAEDYAAFLGLDLGGSNRVFQDGVRRVLGQEYPFGPAART